MSGRRLNRRPESRRPRPLVKQRVISAQRELESRPACLRTVACPLIAADLAQNGNDLATKSTGGAAASVICTGTVVLSPGAETTFGVASRLGNDKAITVDGDMRRGWR